jgi:hypothetical protein
MKISIHRHITFLRSREQLFGYSHGPHMKAIFSTMVAAFTLVAACGGSSTNTNTTTNPPPTQDAAPVATQDTSVKDAGAPGPSLESQREPFVQACMHKMPAQQYCSCAFDQFKDVFKESDLTQKPSDAQMESLKQKTLTNCAPKLTETEVKTSFTAACLSDNAKKQTWCDCEWTTLHAKLALADFVSDFEGQKFDDAKKAVATQCKGKLTEDIAKGEFMSGCNKGGGAGGDHTKACECMWKKLRGKSSVEEIAVGAVDIKKAGLESCKSVQ